MIIHPYKVGSRSAKALKEGLRDEKVRCFISYRPPNARALVVNWGGDAAFLDNHRNVLNRPSDINPLRNKLSFFRTTGHDERVIPWTTRVETASTWSDVFVRHSLTGSGGAGIVVLKSSHGTLPAAPVYTQRVFGSHEFRIHVGRKQNEQNFSVLDVQRKVFRKTPEVLEPKSWAIRSHDNGFVFIRNSQPPGHVLDTVLSLVSERFNSIHFGAFDVIYDEKTDKTYILEGNTAPGLEGQTVQTYVQFFKSMV